MQEVAGLGMIGTLVVSCPSKHLDHLTVGWIELSGYEQVTYTGNIPA